MNHKTHKVDPPAGWAGAKGTEIPCGLRAFFVSSVVSGLVEKEG